MGLFRPSRTPQDGGESTLKHRMALFGAGAVTGLAGIASGTAWVIYLAVAILALAFLLRFTRRD